MNIHQQLRSVLKHIKEKIGPEDFKLRIGLHTLTGSTWASVQRATNTEVLNVWMDTPKPPAVSFQNADGNTILKQQGAQDSDTDPLDKTTSTSIVVNPQYEKLNTVPIVEPFLEWRILDDFGNRDNSVSKVKTKRFLSAIYHSLSASCAPQSTELVPQQGAQRPQLNEIPNGEHTTTISQNLQGDSTHREGSNIQSTQTTLLDIRLYQGRHFQQNECLNLKHLKCSSLR